MTRTGARFLAVLAALIVAGALASTRARELVAYAFEAPEDFLTLDSLTLPGLREPVQVQRERDGRWRIEARNPLDLHRAEGFLQARDRMFQLDLFRHMARGRLTELLGDAPTPAGSVLESDVFQRFVGHERAAPALVAALSPEERAELLAFADGVNHWIATGSRSFEHRLLGADVAPWTPEDTMAVFRTLMFGLGHNWAREARRLVIACEAGLDAMERVWPTTIEHGSGYLPEEAVSARTFPVPPAIAPELSERLPALCPKPAGREGRAPVASHGAGREIAAPFAAAWLSLFREGFPASNNWVLSGARTRSGKPILANDPHLPHMNPPIAWGVRLVLPEREVVGFTFAGIHHVVFGENGLVAWGGTTNNVDTQDLYVEDVVAPSDELPAGGTRHENGIEPFALRAETFRVRGGAEVVRSARFTRHGPVLNDIDAFLRDRIPVTTLRLVPVEGARDTSAVRAAARARDAAELRDGLDAFSLGCVSWVYADVAGEIGFTSPCRVPVRRAWRGTFPVPGWLDRYEWDGLVPTSELPRVISPARGWLATANNEALPADRYPTAYTSDASPPARFRRIAQQLEGRSDVTADEMARLQVDTVDAGWPRAREAIASALCGATRDADAIATGGATVDAARRLCAWDGDWSASSTTASLFAVFANAVLDVALADDLPGGAEGDVWRWVQSTPYFEGPAAWLWRQPADAGVWDDVRTAPRETRDDALRLALSRALDAGKTRWGKDLDAWRWGNVRPIRIHHPLSGASALLGRLLDGPRLQGLGGIETVFKSHYLRSDRERFEAANGPVFRMVIDLGAPAESRFVLAGGQSGRVGEAHYGDMIRDWREGRTHPLRPHEAAYSFRMLPEPRARELAAAGR